MGQSVAFFQNFYCIVVQNQLLRLSLVKLELCESMKNAIVYVCIHVFLRPWNGLNSLCCSSVYNTSLSD